MLLEKKLKNKIFGECITYNGDPFHWIANTATTFLRTFPQKILSGISFWILNFASLIMFDYITSSKQFTGENLALLSFALEIQLSYLLFFNKYHLFIKMLESIQRLHALYTRPPSNSLAKSLNDLNSKLKNLAIILSTTYIIYYIIFTSITSRKSVILGVLLKKMSMSDEPALGLYFLMYGFVIPHGSFFIFMPLMFSLYFNLNFKYLLQLLNESMVMLAKFEADWEKDKKPINADYHRVVNEEMRYFCMQFVRIKKCIDSYVSIAKWRFLSLSLLGGILLGMNLYLGLSVTIQQSPYTWFGIFMIIVGFSAIAESGEHFQLESEKVFEYAHYFKWYNWNKMNRQLLLAFLMQSKEPLNINCYGFAVQDRSLILKINRLVYTLLTFFWKQ